MNGNRIKSAYDTMSPDEAARRRMLERIMEQGGHNVKKEYVAHPQKSRGGLGTLAACLILLILAAGVVTMLNRNGPNHLEDDPSGETTNALLPDAIVQFKDTAFYQAAVEYYSWKEAEGVTDYDRDKMAEIAQSYGLLTYTGDDRGTDDYSYFLECMELESFLSDSPDGVDWDVDSCWWYDQTRFNVAGVVSMAWDDSPRKAPLDFNFFRTTTEYLLPACCMMGPLENYETYLYPQPYGDTAILALGDDYSYVIVQRGEEIIFVEVSNCVYLDSDPDMTPEVLKLFADLFDYTMRTSLAG